MEKIIMYCLSKQYNTVKHEFNSGVIPSERTFGGINRLYNQSTEKQLSY